MSILQEIIVSAFILIGSIFILVGSLGLVKLPDLMARLHAPTKATTLGVGATLVASLIYFQIETGKLLVNELLITLFLVVTAPISAHFIARAYLHLNCTNPAEELPDTCCPCGWSMFDEPIDTDPTD